MVQKSINAEKNKCVPESLNQCIHHYRTTYQQAQWTFALLEFELVHHSTRTQQHQHHTKHLLDPVNDPTKWKLFRPWQNQYKVQRKQASPIIKNTYKLKFPNLNNCRKALSRIKPLLVNFASNKDKNRRDICQNPFPDAESHCRPKAKTSQYLAMESSYSH